MHRNIMLTVLLVAAAVPLSAAEDNPVRRHPAAESTAAVQRYIVKLRAEEPASDGAGLQKAQSAQAQMKALAERSGLPFNASRKIGPGLHVLKVAATAGADTMQEMLERLRADSNVEYAEPDRRRYAHAVPDDPLFVDQWYLQDAEVSGANFSAAWDVTPGAANMVIAVIDTGVRFGHGDLRRVADGGRLLDGYDFISAEAPGEFLLANDGSGWDPNPSDPGDWIDEDDLEEEVFDGCELSPSSWHGTRVAGIVGARTNNAEGMAGGTWVSRVLPVRVLGKCGGFDSDILSGIRWAAGLEVEEVPPNLFPAKVINMSLGATGPCPAAYRDLFDELDERGVMVVVSAGNEAGVPVDSPANCPHVLGVAGLRHVGTKVGFSNIGREIGISAPGGNCVNTGAGQPCLFSIDTATDVGTAEPAGSGYTDQINFNIGTSFSSPIAAAAAALVRSVNPRLTPAQTILRLQQTAKPFPRVAGVPNCTVPTSTSAEQGECNCTRSTCGAGIVDASAAVVAASKPFVIVDISDTSPDPEDTVELDGSDTFPMNGRTIESYAWTVESSTGATPTLTNADAANASFTAPDSYSTTLVLRLTATDSEGEQDSAQVEVTTTAEPPQPPPPDNDGGGGGAVDPATLLTGVGLLLLSLSIRACAAGRRRARPARHDGRACAHRVPRA